MVMLSPINCSSIVSTILCVPGGILAGTEIVTLLSVVTVAVASIVIIVIIKKGVIFARFFKKNI
jgi:hypothetical protein